MRAAVLLALTLATLAACAGPPQGLASQLPGTTWTLERVVGADGSVLRGDGDAVTFGAGGELNVSSCNTCSGRYRLRDGVLTAAGPLACTRKACPAGDVELERFFEGPLAVRRESDYLLLEATTEAGTSQLLFLPAP